MVTLLSLWMPILLSAVFVFVASSIIHMFLGYHASDYGKLANEDAFRNAVRPLGVPPGDYMVPRCESAKDAQTPEYQKKLEEGPVLLMTVMPNGPFHMGKSLALWFGYCVLVIGLAAFVAARTLAPGTPYLEVFCIVAAVSFGGFGFALLQDSIWWNRSWATTARHVFDAFIYSLLTAGTFGWLWPAA